MVFYVGITADYPLTIAQISVLCSMMLVAHNLPMEVAVSRAAGMKVPVALLTRLGGAVLYGILLNWVYQTWSLFDTPSTLIWQPEPSADTWGAWAIGEVKNFFIIIAIIFVLMSLMKLLKAIKITDVLSNYIVGPFLKLFGISKEASLLVVCGMLLGLAYGGAVIIKEARSGALHYRDVFACLFLMNLCHSLVEDTLLMVLLGAELWGILWGRMIFSFILLFVIIKALKHVSNSTFKKYLCGSVARAQT